ncbi:hypothetical protein [Fibrella aestuarina]|nr:hypothetical protein [Fibrella aestuarina]
MKQLYPALLFAFILGPTAVLRAQVRLYTDPNFTGQQAILGESIYNRLGPAITGKVTSVRVPAGYELYAYDRPKLRGQSIRLVGDIPRLVIWDDRIQSARVRRIGLPTQPPRPVIQPPRPVGPIPVTPPAGGRPVVYLYEHERFGGRMIALTPGQYRARDLQGLARQISSVQASAGYVVRLFDRNQFGGMVREVRGQSAELRSVGWDNRAVSLVVARQ